MRSIIDSHAHLTWNSFAEDQALVIQRAKSEGVVQIVQAGVDLATIPEMIRLSEQYEHIYFGAGVHPHEAKHWTEDAARLLSETARHPKMAAFGECGLDFYYDHSERDSQRQAFRAQVTIARELDKPLIIHTRDAWDETFAILAEAGQGKVKGVFHCFTGSPDVLPAVRELDFYVSFSGIITFKNALPVQEAAKLVPGDRLLVETDCPYLAPVPHRGKRNEPSYVWHVAEKVAQLRCQELDSIARLATDNARRLFRLPTP